MKRLFLLGAILFLFVSVVSGGDQKDLYKKQRGQIRFEYDKYKDQTYFTIKNSVHYHFLLKRPDGGNSDFVFSVTVLMPGEKYDPSKPFSMGLMFATIQEGWKYLKCHDLGLLIDGKTQPKLDKLTHDGNVYSAPLVKEFLSESIDLETYLKIATAKTVEGIICNEAFVFSPKHQWIMLEALRQMAPEILKKRNIQFDTYQFTPGGVDILE